MSVFSKLIKVAAPVVATIAPIVGGPAGTAVAAVASAKVASDRRAQAKFLQEKEKSRMMDVGPTSFLRGGADPYASQLIVNAGSPPPSSGFFSTVRSGLQQVGGLVSDAFSSGIPQLFGYNRPQNVQQQPALTTITNVGAQESSGSGSIQQAGFGGIVPGLVSGARTLLKSPLGQVALGGGSAIGLSMIGADGKPVRVTRKMRSQLKNLLRMTGNNYALVGDFLGYSQDMMLFILSKRFRNDGPVVTKAALRKTKQTVRRLKSMCDMYDSLRPTARRRTTPMRRASTTLIKN